MPVLYAETTLRYLKVTAESIHLMNRQTESSMDEIVDRLDKELSEKFEGEEFYEKACETFKESNYDVIEVGETYFNDGDERVGATVEIHDGFDYKGLVSFSFGGSEERPSAKYFDTPEDADNAT